jgi:Flp pilus assembly protein TadG
MWRLRAEEGAVAVMVAVLLVPLFGFGAIAVDVAAMYEERRQLQNGADAAALAVAEDCARELIPCVLGSVEPVAQQYANANARDGRSDVDSLTLDIAAKTVDVVTLSTNTSGANSVTHWFAGVLGITASPVRARAMAQWDVAPASLNAFPLTFCIDVFNKWTADGTAYGGSWPGYQVFYQTPGESLEECEDENYPGGFGWLDRDEQCRAMVSSIPTWHGGETGAALPDGSCVEELRAKIDDPSLGPILIPIFREADPDGNGTNGRFYLLGFGAFQPTGYNFPGTGNGNSYPPGPPPCGLPSYKCIRGWFTEFVTVAGTGSTSGTNYGLTSIQLILPPEEEEEEEA